MGSDKADISDPIVTKILCVCMRERLDVDLAVSFYIIKYNRVKWCGCAADMGGHFIHHTSRHEGTYRGIHFHGIRSITREVIKIKYER